MIDKKYLRYYIFGYLDWYFCSLGFSYDAKKESYQQYKLRLAVRYLGKKDPKNDLSSWAPLINITEAIIGSVLVSFRLLYVIVKKSFVKKCEYNNQLFLASNTIAAFRMKLILTSIRPQQVTCLRIPFIKSNFHENEIDILGSLSFKDIIQSYTGSLLTIWTIYGKYRKRDVMFRSYSSFEYYLTCCFVRRNEYNNCFVYYATFDRWAFLMSATKNSIFIQHGNLTDTLHLIKTSTPYTAYYIN